jgi:multidrug resistance efflux pump
MTTNIDPVGNADPRPAAAGATAAAARPAVPPLTPAPAADHAAPGLPPPAGAGANPPARALQGLTDAPPITPRRSRPSRGRKWGRRLAGMLMVAAGVAAGWYWQGDAVLAALSPKTAAGLGNVQTYTVKRGELRITMVEEGKLRAVNNYTIRMGTSGKITWLAEAGAKVKKGDKLATIDSKQYEDQKKSMEADLDTQQKQLEIAEKAVPIAESNGKAAIAVAQTSLGTAELALKQYTTIDVPKKLNEMETAINDARTKLSDQQKKRADLQRQIDEMLSEGQEKTKLENDIALAKQTEASLKKTVANADDQRKLFRSYNYPQDVKTKTRAVENAKLEVQKAQVQAENDLLAKKAEVQRIKNTIMRTQNNIKQYEDYIGKSTATAPADGLVFYGGPDLDRYGISADSIRVGADWYSSYPIMSIPDLSAFQVAVPVAEVYRGRVNIGMPATVTVDAVPGLVMQGKLTSLSSVSRNKVQYDSSSPQVYDAVLALDSADERLVAGMTVKVEIMTAALPDVLYVPVEAVFNEEGKTAVFVWVGDAEGKDGHVEKRPVLTGQSNDHFVEIKKGLEERDRLLLARPAAFVTPRDYREQVDALFPATKAAAGAGTQGGPDTPPAAAANVPPPPAATQATAAAATSAPATR